MFGQNTGTAQPSLFGGAQAAGGGSLFGNNPNSTPIKGPALQKTTSSLNLFGGQGAATGVASSKSFFPGPGTTPNQQTPSLFGGQAASQQPQTPTLGAQNPSTQNSLFRGGGQTQLTQAQPAGSSLFGAPSQQTLSPQKSLFGGGGGAAAPTGGSLFGGGGAGAQPTGGSLFGNQQQQPTGGSIFGGSQQPAGIFGQTSQPTGGLFQNTQQQQQQQQPQMNPQQLQAELDQHFFQVRDTVKALDMFKTMMHFQNTTNIKLKLNPENADRRVKIAAFDDNTKNVISEIQKRLDRQKELNQSIKQGNGNLRNQISQMKDKMKNSMKDLEVHNSIQLGTKLRLSHLSQDIHKIKSYREQLAQAIYEHNHDQQTQIPLQFFQNLHNEHQKILEILDNKIKEAESLAKIAFTSDEESKEQGVPFKAKIYEICKMIYEQQKAVGLQLKQIDEKVNETKRKFIDVLYRRNPMITQEEIEGIFKRLDNFEVKKALNDVRQKHESIQLATTLNNQLTVLNDKSKDSKKVDDKKAGIAELIQRDAHPNLTTPDYTTRQPTFDSTFTYTSLLGQKRLRPEEDIMPRESEKKVFTLQSTGQQELKYFKSRNPSFWDSQNYSPNIPVERSHIARSIYQPQNYYQSFNRRESKQVYNKGYSVISRRGTDYYIPQREEVPDYGSRRANTTINSIRQSLTGRRANNPLY